MSDNKRLILPRSSANRESKVKLHGNTWSLLDELCESLSKYNGEHWVKPSRGVVLTTLINHAHSFQRDKQLVKEPYEF